MKKYVFYPLLISILPTCALSLSCNQPKNLSPSPIAPQKRLISPQAWEDREYGEDFDFAPRSLPQPPPNVWDTSAVDLSDIDPERKLISFTFDDAPASTLENILAVFASYNESNPDCKATATLFCNGMLMDESTLPNLSAALTLGWELGNHTQTHPDLTTITQTAFLTEVAQTETLLTVADGREKHLFRAPFGKINDEKKQALNVPIINWTIDTLDWSGTSAEEIYDTVFSQKFSGAIVLMHDGYKNTVTALKRLLPDLKEAGYQVVSVSKMAKAHHCKLKNGSVYIRARKQGNG